MVATAAIIGGMAAVQVISGLMQAHQQKQGQKGAANELAKIKAVFDAIKPPELDIDIDDPPELIAEVADSIDYDWSGLSPEQYEVIGQYTPEIAPYIAEQAPQLVEESAAGREGLQAQQQALRKLKDVAGGGIDPQFAQRMREAAQSSQQAAQSRSDSIMQDYERRGLLGSGTQLASELSAAEGAMERGAQQSSDAATQAYLNQLGALRDSANLGGTIRGQDIDLASKNASIANAFNQRTTAAFQRYLQNAANTRNDAELQNLNTAQDVANRNVGVGNEAQILDRDRKDRLQQDLYTKQIQQKEAINRAALDNWANTIKKGGIIQDRKNQLFDRQLRKAAGSTGGIVPAAQNIKSGAQIDANAISGLGKAATTGILTASDLDQKEKDRKLLRDIYG